MRKAGGGALLFIFILVLVDSIGFGIILPVLPRLIMQLTGVGIDRAARYGGWLSFVYALMQFFCASVLGNTWWPSCHRNIAPSVSRTTG